MRILITGGAGFIGHNLAREAVARGHDVRILDDLSTGYVENLDGLDVDFREASLLDETAVASALRKIDSVVHLGALGSVPRSIADPLKSHHVNATGTLTLLEQARAAGVGHVISASSSSVYGMNPVLPKDESAWVRPMSPYAVSKLATEQYTLAYQESFGLNTLAFRFFNVYGPGQRAGHAYAAVIPTFVDAILRGQPVVINGDGTTSRDFTFVATVCDVLLKAVSGFVGNAVPVNLAFGTKTSLLELVSQLRAATSMDFEVRFRDARPGDVPHSEAANEALLSLFRDIAPVSLQDGLRRTVDWFRNVYEC